MRKDLAFWFCLLSVCVVHIRQKAHPSDGPLTLDRSGPLYAPVLFQIQ